ncbi:Hsp20/alpha crystallin family protein [Peribacillus sp. NPDC006672]|uniref:Hsp20/alpha crystallin family protein n=1 Tax=Peribacillus sp. NPDC006672 TaxID=3390606 RepID=UPI003D0129ED
MLPFSQLFSPLKNGIQKWVNQPHEEINKYINEAFSKSMNGSLQNDFVREAMGIFEQPLTEQENSSQKLDVAKFETHDHVYLKIHVKDPTVLSNVKVFFTSNQSIIEGIPKENDRHVITLPSIVKSKEAKAEYRDHYLQIQIPKKVDTQFTEIDVQGID